MFRVYKIHSFTLNHNRIINFPTKTRFLIVILLQEKTKVTMKISLLLKYRQWQFLLRDYIQNRIFFFVRRDGILEYTSGHFQSCSWRQKRDSNPIVGQKLTSQWKTICGSRLYVYKSLLHHLCWFATLSYYILHRLIFFSTVSIFAVLLCFIDSRV